MIVLFACKSGQNETADTPPNVIFILTDDQGWGDLSINGNTNLHTPNIDRLSENGATFDRFYVSPVCSPTRAEILTGRYHPRGGVYSTSAGGERLDLDETTIAEVFKKAGYNTAAYGKWHNGMQYPYHPNGRGFDDFYGFCSGHWGNYFSPMLEHNGQIVKGEGFLTDDLTNHAIEFIQQNKDKPFFLYLPYNIPHSPMQVPDEWYQKFDGNKLEMQNRNPELEDMLHTRAALAMCENIDWNVGRILDKINALGIEENTIVVYLSDNGPNGWRWNDGMKGRKGSTDEGGVRSPTFIQWKDHIPRGKNIPQISSAIDFLPTLTDLAGIESATNKPVDGVSLKPLLLENDPNWEDRLIFSHWRGRVSVRSQKYRLDHENQLFDMVNDPGQSTNISENQMEITNKLIAARQNWVTRVLAEIPDEDPRGFSVGHPDFIYTQIPARDGKAVGNIKRSNKYPNDSFFYNWTGLEDAITWDIDVIESGDFMVEVYYTCPEADVGAEVQLRFRNNALDFQVNESHDPPLTGMENDRSPRIESYVKDFKPMTIGTIFLEKGRGKLELSALNIPGKTVMDVRLLMLKRI